MNKLILLIVCIGLFICLGCGKKGDPKYMASKNVYTIASNSIQQPLTGNN